MRTLSRNTSMTLLALLIAMFGMSFSAEAQGKPNESASQTQVIQDESIKHLEGTVEVRFRIGSDGKVQIVDISATNTQLADYVIKKLSKIKLEKSEAKDGPIIKYRFVFKKQT